MNASLPSRPAHKTIHPGWLNTIADHLERTARTSPDRVAGVVLDHDSVQRLLRAFAPVADLSAVCNPRGQEGWLEIGVRYVPQEIPMAESLTPRPPLVIPAGPSAPPTVSSPPTPQEINPAIRPVIKAPHPLFQALEEASCALFVAEERARRAMALARQFDGLPKLEHTLWETYGQLYERLYDLQQLVGTASGEDSVSVALTRKFVNGRRRASALIDQMEAV